jgi:hypothetical protein
MIVQKIIDGMKLFGVKKKNFMSDRNQQGQQNPLQDDMSSKEHDRQGIDKTPGEETAQDLENVVSDTQRGKNKVDGDPEKESDQPIEQSRH